MDTKIFVNGVDVTGKFASKDANKLGVILKTDNPASKAWFTFTSALPSTMIEALTSPKNASKTLTVEIAPDSNEAGKKVTVTYAQIVAKINLAKKLLEMMEGTKGWKYEILDVGTATGKETKAKDVDYSDSL